VPDDAAWPIAIGLSAEVAAVLGSRSVAADLVEILLPFDGFRQFGTGGIMMGPSARLLARLELVLDLPDDADRHFAEALAQSVAFESPMWIARCALDWAESLIDRGEASRAVDLVDQAEVALVGLSLPALEQQVVRLRARV